MGWFWSNRPGNCTRSLGSPSKCSSNAFISLLRLKGKLIWDPHAIWNGHQQTGQVSGSIALICCIHIERISFHTIKRAIGNRVSKYQIEGLEKILKYGGH